MRGSHKYMAHFIGRQAAEVEEVSAPYEEESPSREDGDEHRQDLSVTTVPLPSFFRLRESSCVVGLGQSFGLGKLRFTGLLSRSVL